MASIFKFGIKSGILGGTIYYSKNVGVWADSDTTYELGQKSITYVIPYFNKLRKEVPIPAELKNLPSSEDVCRTVSSYWNKGVISSISFIEKIPSNLNYYTCQGISYLRDQIQQEKTLQSPNQESS